jgi:hypothetical protein
VIPESVEVGPYTYMVTADRDEMNAVQVRERETLYGATDHKKQTIYLDGELALDQLGDTVLHECLHVLMHFTGLATEMGEEAEERVVSRLAPALLLFVRSNFGLLAFLAGYEMKLETEEGQ